MTRIIAGRAKGRRLAAPDHGHTRPTSDRVREALFSTLGSWFETPGDRCLEGMSFLDLYAGSGAVGLEAASRGAAPVVMVEADRRTADLARSNTSISALSATVRAAKVEQFIGQPGPSDGFDIVWMDPPYDVATDTINGLLAEILHKGWIARQGLFAVERSSRSDPVTWPTQVYAWERRYGETTLYFAELEEQP